MSRMQQTFPQPERCCKPSRSSRSRNTRAARLPKPPAYNYQVPKMAPGVATSHMQFDDPLQFWSIFSAAMNENPPPESEIKSVLPQFKYLGIELGKQWK